LDIEASARKHGVSDNDMLHAPLEVGVVTDSEGSAVIHAMPARQKFLKGWRQQ